MKCSNECPCFEQCPQGCQDCPNPICGCANPDTNEDYITCENFYRLIYRKGTFYDAYTPKYIIVNLIHVRYMMNLFESECIIQCETGDSQCFQSCAREYSENLTNCPCQENCPLGCPCPEYQCPLTTTQMTTTTAPDLNTWILVLNTNGRYNVPLIIDGKGKSKEIEFTYGYDTIAQDACSVVWWGQMYLFGGVQVENQISVVSQCQLKRVGNLPFDMRWGACAQQNNENIFICFEHASYSETWKNCHRSSGPLEAFEQLPSTTYEHRSTHIAATKGNFLNFIIESNKNPPDYLIAVGGQKQNDGHKTELLSRSNSWSLEANFPFGKEYFDL